jgi:HEAT repeat protein
MLLASRHVVIHPEVERMFAELSAAAGLQRGVKLTTSPECPVPMALTSSEVCVPARFLVDLDPEQQRGALAHEVAHLARRDPQWLGVDAIIGSVLFFQPLNVVARRELREEAEMQCDDWAARQGAGLGLARCLADVAAWLTPFPRSLLAVTIPMAAGRSRLVRRVERLLANAAAAAPMSRVRPFAFACLVVAAIAGAVPAFSADPSVAPGNPLTPPDPATSSAPAVSGMIGRTETQSQIVRPGRPDDPLAERWASALRDARARSQRAFWVGYSFDFPLRGDQQHLSDSDGINLDRIDWRGVTLGGMLGVGVSDRIAIFAHYRRGAEATLDRITHRSMNAPMDFGGDAVYWLGAASDVESVPWLDSLQQRMTTTALRSELVEALSMHRTTAAVLPVLDRLLGSDRDADVRAEAAEGLEHHDVPAALQLAHRTATRDSDRSVRAEAAEAIGEIHTAGAVDVLIELANLADDSEVRGEAAEALGSQPDADAVRGIEAVVFNSSYEDARLEAVEALGEIEAAVALSVLRRIVSEHPSLETQVEAVETIGDLEGIDVLGELRELLERHPEPRVRDEALEVLSGLDTPAAYALILEMATRAESADTRREAIEAVADASEKGRSSAELEQAAALLEQTIFNDRDESVQREAIEALAHLPRQRALDILRRVVETHASSRVRRAAIEAIADLGRR